MKTFAQINEYHTSPDKIDKLVHPGKLDAKRLAQLKGDYSAYKDIDFDSFLNKPFPKNSSTETFNELKLLMSLGQFRTQWEDEMVMYDTKVIKPFKDYCDAYGIEVDFTRIKHLMTQTNPILLALKKKYNRPRPVVLAKNLGLSMTFFPLTTSKTPSYPSGHATQGYLVALLVADELPLEHRKNVLKTGLRIGESRQIAGAHYPSDTKFGLELANEFYRLSKMDSLGEPELKLESKLTLKEMTLKAMQQQIADLDPGLEVVSKTRRIGNTGNLTSKEFKDKLEKDMGASNIQIIKPLQGTNDSSAFDMFRFEFDSEVYSVYLAGRVAGRGTNATDDNETSFLLVLAARQHGATDEEESIKFKMIDPKVFSKVEGLDKSKAMSLVAYMENQPSWFLSHRKQTNALMAKIGKKIPIRYAKDSSKHPINLQAKALYKANFNDNLDVDKWNPADVWLEYGNLPEHKTLTHLNNFCFNSIKKVEGIVGISLKKGSGKISYVNYDKEKEPYILNNINFKLSKLWALAATIQFDGKGLDGISLGFRIFNGKSTDTITGEADQKGADAVQGKVKLALLDQFTGLSLRKKVVDVGGSDILDYNRNTGKYSLTKEGKQKYKKVQTAWKVIKGTKLEFARGAQKKNYDLAFDNDKNFIDMLNKENLPENKGKAVINSRFQTLMLCYVISSMSKVKAKKLALQLLKYGKSMSEWSAAHLKLQ